MAVQNFVLVKDAVGAVKFSAALHSLWTQDIRQILKLERGSIWFWYWRRERENSGCLGGDERRRSTDEKKESFTDRWKYFFAVVNDNDNANLGSLIVYERIFAWVGANINPVLQTALGGLLEAVADQKGQDDNKAQNNRDSGKVGNGGQLEELFRVLQSQSLKKGNAASHTVIAMEDSALRATCSTEKAAWTKRLLEVTVLWSDNAAWKERIEERTRRLEVKMITRERSIADKRHTKGAVFDKKGLADQVKQLSVRVAELKGKVVKGMESVPHLNVNLKATEKRVDDAAKERDCLQARLQQSQCGQDKSVEMLTRVQDAIDGFSPGLKENRNYFERLAHERCRTILD